MSDLDEETFYLGITDPVVAARRYKDACAMLTAMTDDTLRYTWHAVWTTDEPPHEDWIELVYAEMSNRGIPAVGNGSEVGDRWPVQ